MYLYILTAPECSWDEFDDILVQAHTEDEARSFIKNDAYNSMGNWFTEKGFKCKRIGTSELKGKPEWLLGSFNAG